MATANIGSIIGSSVNSIPLYTTTTNQFDKTVFTGVASPYTVVLPTRIINSAANISYSTTTGEYTLTSGLTYQLTVQGNPLVNYKSATPATWQWWNTTGNSAVGPALPVGTTLSIPYKPASTITMAVKVIAGANAFDYPAYIPNTIRTSAVVVSGWTE